MTETEDLDSRSGVDLPDDLLSEDLHTLNISRDSSIKPDSKASASKSVFGTESSVGKASTAGIQKWQAMSQVQGGENLKPHQRFTGYDAQGRAHQQDISFTISTFDDDSDTTTAPASRIVKNNPESKFAKVRPVQRKVVVPVTHEGRNVKYDTDDDEDEEEQDDYFAY